MKTYAWLMLALVVAALVSGCADKKETTETSVPTTGGTTTTSTGGTNSAGSTQPSSGTPVNASFQIKVNGTVMGPVNGSVPIPAGENITFDASDSKGDNLTYEWDFGDASFGENETEVHQYAPGMYNVTLTVTGGSQSDEKTVMLNVTGAGGAAGSVVWTQPVEASGTLVVGNPNSPMQADIDYADHPVTIAAADPNGTAVLAKRANFALTHGPTGADMMMYWRAPDGTVLASNTFAETDDTLAFEGDMPPGEYVLRVRLFAGAAADYDVTGTIEYEAG